MSALQPIEPVGLGDRTFVSIRRAIITGELAPGAPLRDRVLAEALGVSRTPVREALHRLEHGGLVRTAGRSGWVVAPFTEQDIHELFELRRALEPLGLDRMQADPDLPVRDELAGAFGDFAHPVAQERFDEYFARDNDFHKHIVASSGNERLIRFYSVIESHIDRGRHFLSTSAAGRVDASLDEHRAITNAIATGDFDEARSQLRHHLNMGEQLMVDQLRKSEGGS